MPVKTAVKELSKEEKGADIMEELFEIHINGRCSMGPYRKTDEKFMIVPNWSTVEEFTFDVIERVCGEEILEKYYPESLENRKIEYGDLSEENERGYYKVPDEVKDKLCEYGIVEHGKRPSFGNLIGDMDWGFADEYTLCGECRSVVRTSPDSYSWTANHAILGYDIYCMDCIRENDTLTELYIAKLSNEPSKANTILEPGSLRRWSFVPLCEAQEREVCEFDSGFYRHNRNDNPEEQYKRLKEDFEEIIFDITTVGQFSTSWQIWVK